MKQTLIIVDVQYDFCNPNGALYVKGGELIIDKIKSIISKFDSIVFTLDWHPFNHCSFKENGGIWPTHCIAHTSGASIPNDLIIAAEDKAEFYYKASSSYKEVYGAFDDFKEENEWYVFNNVIRSEIVVCGIAGDYCVLETIKNLLACVSKERISVFIDGIVSIDGGDKLNQFIKENNIKIYQHDN